MQIFSWHMLCLISYKRRWEEASWRGCESTSSSSTSEIKNPNSHAVSSTSRACHCLSASPTIILGQFAATAVSLRLSHEIILWPVNDRLITSFSRDAATERQSVNDNIVFSQAWNISQNSTVCHKGSGASTNKKSSNGCWEIRNQPTILFSDDHIHLLCSRAEHRNTNFRNYNAR